MIIPRIPRLLHRWAVQVFRLGLEEEAMETIRGIGLLLPRSTVRHFGSRLGELWIPFQ
jgi:hypothetical protein